jgi:hypothetical protein
MEEEFEQDEGWERFPVDGFIGLAVNLIASRRLWFLSQRIIHMPVRSRYCVLARVRVYGLRS